MRERQELRNKRREFRRIKDEVRATRDAVKRDELEKKKEAARTELLRLEERLDAAMRGRAGGREGGALPDFVIVGASRSGTTSLYHLLARHPLVEPAETKELHFFDKHFRQGVGWYRGCFPEAARRDGRRSVTGEATPYYLFHPLAAERAANVIPQARLIALLRNPVDRAYSQYQQQVKRGREPLTFEEAIEAEGARLDGEWAKTLENEDYDSYNLQRYSYLSRGVYVDQLLRWRECFPVEQMLVLKSEAFFQRPQEILERVLRFLDLPEWEHVDWELGDKRNKGVYSGGMDTATRQELEAYFEPHNRRLYEHLGEDFRW